MLLLIRGLREAVEVDAAAEVAFQRLPDLHDPLGALLNVDFRLPIYGTPREEARCASNGATHVQSAPRESRSTTTWSRD